ncbi:hypothetical protein ACSF86_03935 [Moraxella bovoculi]
MNLTPHQAKYHAYLLTRKAWCYLLIPHNEVLESKKLIDFLQFERK